jgi:hypothetical protein
VVADILNFSIRSFEGQMEGAPCETKGGDFFFTYRVISRVVSLIPLSTLMTKNLQNPTFTQVVKRFCGLYLWHLLTGAFLLILVEDPRWFLFFLLFEMLFFVDYLRKLIRVFQAVNDVRLIAIIRKLKISDEDLEIVTDSMKATVGEIKWNQFEKELQEIQ